MSQRKKNLLQGHFTMATARGLKVIIKNDVNKNTEYKSEFSERV